MISAMCLFCSVVYPGKIFVTPKEETGSVMVCPFGGISHSQAKEETDTAVEQDTFSDQKRSEDSFPKVFPLSLQ